MLALLFAPLENGKNVKGKSEKRKTEFCQIPFRESQSGNRVVS